MEENKQTRKPKPVTFIAGKYGYYKHDTMKELMLLKAMRITNDPKKLRDMIGAKTIADVSRTFDKLSMRKEWYASLRDLNMDFKWLATGLKQEADSAEKSADRIKAMQIILKSLGMDAYEDTVVDTGTWEDLLLKASSKEIEDEVPDEEYEVTVPQVPESAKLKQEENQRGKSIYE